MTRTGWPPMRRSGVLASYSMITLTPETVSMHRLVQAVILARQPRRQPGVRRPAAADHGPGLARTRRSPSPDTNMAGWPLLRALVPHAEALAALFPPGRPARDAGPGPERVRGFSCDSQGQYEQALALRAAGAGDHRGGPRPRPPRHGHRAGQPGPHLRDLGRPAEALPLAAAGAGRSPRPPSAPTTPARPSGWTTWPPPTAIWGGRRGAAAAAAGAGDHRGGPRPRPPRHGHPAGQPGRHLPRPGAARRGAAAAAAGAGDHRGGPRPRPPRHGHLAGQPGRAPTALWGGTARRCRCSSGRWRSPRPPSAPTTPTRPSGWTTSPPPTATWGGTARRCRCSSGRWRSPRRRWAPTTPTRPPRWTTWPHTYSDLGQPAVRAPTAATGAADPPAPTVSRYLWT